VGRGERRDGNIAFAFARSLASIPLVHRRSWGSSRILYPVSRKQSPSSYSQSQLQQSQNLHLEEGRRRLRPAPGTPRPIVPTTSQGLIRVVAYLCKICRLQLQRLSSNTRNHRRFALLRANALEGRHVRCIAEILTCSTVAARRRRQWRCTRRRRQTALE
jgi:hypothetical protein